MSLSNFFEINMPYGMTRNSKNEWLLFNREYMPIGWNDKSKQQTIFLDDCYNSIPAFTYFPDLSDEVIEMFIDDKSLIKHDKEGRISRVFFYEDRTNPVYQPKHWDNYFQILKSFSSLANHSL